MPDSIPVDTSANSAFSRSLPGLQLAWDSTSLGTLKRCPREYKYAIVDGWTPKTKSVDLFFGQVYHAARERYDHARARGEAHEVCLRAAVRYALEATWDTALQRPWISEDNNKNRYTLLRTLVWYLDQFQDDPIQTLILANGKPAVELSFRFAAGKASAAGEEYLFCGHLDRVGVLNAKAYILDAKTTRHTLSPDYFAQYTPDNQFSLYTLAGAVAYSLPVEGIIVDAAQVAVTFSRFQRGFVQRTKDQVDEWMEDAHKWIDIAEGFAREASWPMNDKACFRCAFRPICSKTPSVRQRWLEASYGRRVWDPLQVRGDV